MEIVPFFMLAIMTFIVIAVAFVLFFLANRPSKPKDEVILLEARPPAFNVQSNPFNELLNRQMDVSNLFESASVLDPDKEPDFDYLVDKKIKELSKELSHLRERKRPVFEPKIDSKSIMSMFEPKDNIVGDIFKKRPEVKKRPVASSVKKDESLEQLFQHSEILNETAKKQKKESPKNKRMDLEAETKPPVQREAVKDLVAEKVSAAGEDPYQLKKYEVEYLLALLGRKKPSS